MRTIGLTGGIGSGKSEVSGMLAALGAVVIDADHEGHRTYERGTEGWRRVVDRFGDGILDAQGEVDRKRLAGIVFGDAAALTDLNALLHPLIRARVETRLRALRDGAVAVTVVEATLLLEAGWEDLVDEVWLVQAPAAVVTQRLREQRRMTEAQIAARVAAQRHQAAVVARRADVVIQNDGTRERLRAEVERLWRQRIATKAQGT